MKAANTSPAPVAAREFDRGLWLLVAGAIILVVIGLISLPLLQRRESPLAAATTPEGTVQRFYAAIYDSDYAAAYQYLSSDARDRIALAELQQQISMDLRNSQARVGSATIRGDSATVSVTLTHFGQGGLFGSNEWTEQRDVLLQREGDRWTITSGPFYLPYRATP